MRIKVESFNPSTIYITGNKKVLQFEEHSEFEFSRNGVLLRPSLRSSREIHLNLATGGIQNLSDVFSFEIGLRHFEISLYQLVLVSDLGDYLLPFMDVDELDLEESNAKSRDYKTEKKNFNQVFIEVALDIEIIALQSQIDYALQTRNKQAFMELSAELNKILNTLKEVKTS